MNRNGRLPKTVKSQFTKRRLDMVTERNEMVKDILQIGGEAELISLQSEISSFGDSLEETLETLSLPRIKRIHARVVLGTLDIPWVDDF